MSDESLGLISAHLASPSETLQEAVNYWTATRMQQAKPVPMPSVTAEQHDALMDELRRVQKGLTDTPSWVVPPVSPGRELSPRTGSRPTRQTARVTDLSGYPASVVCKMFMAFGGGLSMGSAYIIGKKAILTAGHCVYDRATRKFASKIQFLPGYQNGAKPFGAFTAVQVTTLREYVELNNGRQFVYDIGACVVDKEFPAELGQAGYALNTILAPGPLTSYGYPAAPYAGFPFQGEELWQSIGDYHHEDDGGFGTSRERNFGHYNDLTQGCSGGPIFTADTLPIAVGLNSHFDLNPRTQRRMEPPRIFSPYFGDSVKRLLTWLKQNGGEPNEPGLPPAPDPREDSEPPGCQPDRLKAGLQEVVDKLNELIVQL